MILFVDAVPSSPVPERFVPPNEEEPSCHCLGTKRRVLRALWGWEPQCEGTQPVRAGPGRSRNPAQQALHPHRATSAREDGSLHSWWQNCPPARGAR